MKVEEVKELLRLVRSKAAVVDSLRALADRYAWLAKRIGGQRFEAIRVSGGPGEHDRVANTVLQLVDAEERLREKAETELLSARQAEELIQLVGDPVKAAILRRRYLLGESWKQVVKAVHYTRSYCDRLHGEALAEIARKTGF